MRMNDQDKIDSMIDAVSGQKDLKRGVKCVKNMLIGSKIVKQNRKCIKENQVCAVLVEDEGYLL